MLDRKKIVILGATGSIGSDTLKVLREHHDSLELIGIAADKNFQKLALIAHEFSVPHVAIYDENAYDKARKSSCFPSETVLYGGMDGLNSLASLQNAHCIVMSIIGTLGLEPTLNAIRAGKAIALASKEILVLAGHLVIKTAQQCKVKIFPLDSEHSAIFQCLQGSRHKDVEKVILTASGGALRNWTSQAMRTVTPSEALRHPTWKMGPKITIDCATLANKGLEMIEAHWLFGVRADQIEVVVHPQSIVHSMVQFRDGVILAQMGPTSMTLPIQYSLLYPERKNSSLTPLDFTKNLKLEFEPPDYIRFPCLSLARQALNIGGSAPGVFNAANEVAVQAFLDNTLPLLKISAVIEKTLEIMPTSILNTMKEILELHEHARQCAIKALHVV